MRRVVGRGPYSWKKLRETGAMVDLTGRVAVVTGGSEGIGRSVAEALAERGASVVLTSRSGDRAASVAEEIDARVEGAVKGMACDVRDPDQCRALVSNTLEAFGGLDIPSRS